MPAPTTIPEAFAAQVARFPDRPAVLAADAALTYRELAAAVSGTAAALRAAVPGAGGRIAVLCRHGADTVTGLLAALVAGHAYVPLDPAFPEQRLARILTDSAPPPSWWTRRMPTSPPAWRPRPVPVSRLST